MDCRFVYAGGYFAGVELVKGAANDRTPREGLRIKRAEELKLRFTEAF